jgi:hypothetical protein
VKVNSDAGPTTWDVMFNGILVPTSIAVCSEAHPVQTKQTLMIWIQLEETSLLSPQQRGEFVLCQRLKGGFERPGLLTSLVGLKFAF